MATASSHVGERPNSKEIGAELPLEKKKLLEAHAQLEKEGERLQLKKMLLLGHYKECEKLREEVLSAEEASSADEKLVAYKTALEKAFVTLETVQQLVRSLNGTKVMSKAEGLSAVAKAAREKFEKEEDERAKKLKDKALVEFNGEAAKDQKIRSKRTQIGQENVDKDRAVERANARKDKQSGNIVPTHTGTDPERLAQEAMGKAAEALRFAFGDYVTEAMAKEFNYLTRNINPEQQAEILSRLVDACRELSEHMGQSGREQDWRARAREFGLLDRGGTKKQASDTVDIAEIRDIITRAINKQKIFYPATGHIKLQNSISYHAQRDTKTSATQLARGLTGFDFDKEKGLGQKNRAEKEVTIYCKTKLAETVGTEVAEMIWEPLLDMIEKQPTLDVLALVKKMHKEMETYLKTATVRLEGKRSKREDIVEQYVALLGLSTDTGVSRRAVERLVRRVVEKRKPLFPVNVLNEAEFKNALSLDIEERLSKGAGDTMYQFRDLKFPVHFEKGKMVISLRDNKKVSFGPEDDVSDIDARITAFIPEPKRLTKKEAKESKAHHDVLEIVTGPLALGLGEDVANALYVATADRVLERRGQAKIIEDVLDQSIAYIRSQPVLGINRENRNGEDGSDWGKEKKAKRIEKEVARRIAQMGLVDQDGLVNQEAINTMVTRAMAGERIFPLIGTQKENIRLNDIDSVYGVGKSVKKEGEDEERINEDSMISLPEIGLYGVFDGVGGHGEGEEASLVIAMHVSRHALDIPSDYNTPEKTLEMMQDMLRKANKELHENRGKESKMATTASVVKILPGPEGSSAYRAVVAHVGDSRVGVRYPDGTFETITEDDAEWPIAVDYWATQNENIKKHIDQVKREIALTLDGIGSDGSLHPSEFLVKTLLPVFQGSEEKLGDQLMLFFRRRNHILQAIGLEQKVEVKGYIRDLPAGARLVLVTDGVSDNIPRDLVDPTRDQWMSELDPKKYATPEEASQALIEAAQEISRQGKKKNVRSKFDDMTAIVVDLGVEPRPRTVAELPPIPVDEEAIKFADDADVTEVVSETVQWYRDLEKAFGPDVLAHIRESDDEGKLVLECDKHEYPIKMVMRDVQDETNTSFFLEMKDGSSLQIMPGFSFDMIRTSIEQLAQHADEVPEVVETNEVKPEASPVATQPAGIELKPEAKDIELFESVLPQYLFDLIGEEELDHVFDGLTDVTMPVEEKQRMVLEMMDGDLDPTAANQLMEALRLVGVGVDIKGLIEIWKKEMHQDFFAVMMHIVDQQRKNEEAAQDKKQEAELAKLPLVERIKQGIKDNALGIFVGVGVSAVATPVGGAAAGLFTTRVANLFGRNRKRKKEAVQMQDRIRKNMEDDKHQIMTTALKEVFLNRNRMSSERAEGIDETNLVAMAKLNYMRTMKDLARIAQEEAEQSGTPEAKEYALEARAAYLKAEIDFRNTVKLKGNLKECVAEFTVREKFMATWNEAVESFKNGKLRELWAHDESEVKRWVGHFVAATGGAGMVKFLALSAPAEILTRMGIRTGVAAAGGATRGFFKETRGSEAALSIEVEKLLKQTGHSTAELGSVLEAHLTEMLTKDADGQLKKRIENAIKTGTIYGALAGVFGGAVEAVRHWDDIWGKMKGLMPSGSSSGSRLAPLQEIPQVSGARDAGVDAGVLTRADGGFDAGTRPTSVDAGTVDAGSSRPISGSADGGMSVAAGTKPEYGFASPADTRGASLDAGMRDGGSLPDASVARGEAAVVGSPDGGAAPAVPKKSEYGTAVPTTADTLGRDGGTAPLAGGTDITRTASAPEAAASVAPETATASTSSASEPGTFSMPKEDGSYTLYSAKESTSPLRVKYPAGPQSVDLGNGAIELPEISGDDDNEGATDSFFNFFKETRDPATAVILQKFVDDRAGTVSADKIERLIQRRHGIAGLTEGDIRRISLWVFQEPVTVIDTTGTAHEVAFIDAKGHTNLGIEKGAGFKIQIDKGNVIMRQVGGEGLYTTDIPPKGEAAPVIEDRVARTEAPTRTASASRAGSSESVVPEVSGSRSGGSTRIPEILAAPKTDFPETIIVGGGDDYTATGEFVRIQDTKGVDHEAMRYGNGREQVIVTDDGAIYDSKSSDRVGHVDLEAEAEDMIYQEDDVDDKVDLGSEYTVSAPSTTEKLDKINVVTTMEKGRLAVNHIEVKSPISKDQAVKLVFGKEVDKDVERVMKTASSSLREKVQNLALLNDAYRTLRKDGEGDSEMARALHNKIMAEMKLLPKVLGYPEKTPEDIFDRSILEDHGLDITASGEYWNDLEVMVERNYSGAERQTLLNYLKLTETRGKIYTDPKLMEKLLMTAGIPNYEIDDSRTVATVNRLVEQYHDASQVLELHIKSGKSLEYIRKQLLPFSFEFDHVLDKDITKMPESTLAQAVIRSDATTLGENTKIIGNLRQQLAEDAARPRVEVKAPTSDEAKGVGDRIEKKMKGRGLNPKMDIKGGKDKS